MRPKRRPAPASEPPCTCRREWTEQQRRAFGDLPVKWQDCPRHDAPAARPGRPGGER